MSAHAGRFPPSWITQARPDSAEAGRLTPDVVAVLERVAGESKDQGARLYTQAEMVRAIELAVDRQQRIEATESPE